jgi:hypothetical protein
VSGSVGDTISIELVGRDCFIQSTSGGLVSWRDDYSGTQNPTPVCLNSNCNPANPRTVITITFEQIGTTTWTALQNTRGLTLNITVVGTGPPSPTPIILPPVLFTLGFDANGGTCSVTNSGSVESGSWTSVPTAEQCTRSGYTLLGWNPRSDGGDPLGFSPGGSTHVTGDNTLYAIWQVVPAAAPPSTSVEKSITIAGRRMQGNSNQVFVEGASTGLPAGTVVIPYFRFPGQVGFAAGISRTTGADGNFSWQRKTGKRVAVRFTTADGSVISNTVIIQAR